MNELGLPSHGHEPSFAADETTYGTVVRTATRRRRTRAVAGTSTTAALALVAFAALSGPGGGTASLEPADDPLPRATHAVAPSPSAARADGSVGGALPPPFPTLPPLPTGSPSQKPSATARPTGTPRPSPAATSRAEWHESWQYVAEDPTKTCHRLDAPNWCLRYAGPMSARSGEPVAFVNEMCRMSTARAASRIDLRHSHDLVVVVGRTTSSNAGETWAVSVRGEVEDRPHSIPVSPGQCVRWTTEWNGVASNAPALDPGTYTVAVFLQGETPGEQPAGSQEPKRGWAFQVEGFQVS